MVGGSWLDNDGLYRQYGTTKAIPEVAGDYLSYGEDREIEITATLSALTATPLIISNTTFMPVGVFIDSVETVVEVASTGASTLSVGLIGLDRSTVASNTGFIATATVGAQGVRTLYTAGVSGAGTYVGAVAGTPVVGYITVTGTATPYTTGVVKIRIKYRGIGTITQ
jgi:hypothetical protein